MLTAIYMLEIQCSFGKRSHGNMGEFRMRRVSRSPVIGAWIVVVALAGIHSAATPSAAQAPTATSGCDSDAHRQFDFWVGDWEVTTADGAIAGTNRVEKILDGCVIKENWVGTGDMRGESYNIFSQRRGKWHQSWVDTTGRLLLLEGGLEGGKMVLSGQMPGQDGKMVRHEISWEALGNGHVKQHWRASRDRRKSWDDLFVGFYARNQ